MEVLVSAVMIAKNEERCIIRCLDSIYDDVDEIVVVDTGSIDRTLQLLRDFPDTMGKLQIHQFEWQEDFAAARNFSIEKARGIVSFSIDADEYLHPEDKGKLRSFCKELVVNGVHTMCSLTILNTVNGKVNGVFNGAYRIFTTAGYRFKFPIHETLYPIVDTHNKGRTIVRLLHDGYDQRMVNRKEKKMRNLKLLKKRLQDDPNDYWALMYIGDELIWLDIEKAEQYIVMAERLAGGKDNSFSAYLKGVKDNWTNRKHMLNYFRKALDTAGYTEAEATEDSLIACFLDYVAMEKWSESKDVSKASISIEAGDISLEMMCNALMNS